MNNSSFRSTVGWKDTAYNSLSSSYSYGYAGGRTDLPATGYDPVYPVNSSAYQQHFTPPASNQYSYHVNSGVQHQQQQQQNPEVLRAPYQEEYNPEYPGYSYSKPAAYSQQHFPSVESQRQSQYQQYQAEAPSTSYIRLNSSAFSLRNTLEKAANYFGSNRHTSRAPFSSTSKKAAPSFPKKPSGKSSQPVKAISGLAALNGTKSVVSSVTQPVKKDSDPEIIEVKSVSSASNTGMGSKNRNNNRGGRGGQSVRGGGFSRGGGGNGNNGNRNGGGVQKRRSFEPYPTPSSSRGGGYSSSWGGGGRGGRRPPRATNKQDDIPFVALTDADSVISIQLDPENLECFHGPSSVFTTQHTFPVMIDDRIYESVDHYYQIQKVKDLCGNVSQKMTETVRDRQGRRLDGQFGFRSKDEKSFSQIAREQLKLSNIDKKVVDEWRNTKGLQAVQTALHAKVCQSAHLREAIKETTGKLMVHAYAGDSIYGAGTTIPQIKKWCENMKKNGTTVFKVPSMFPLTEETVQKCPNFAQGRNILGVILMQLRELLVAGKIETVDMTAVFEGLKKNVLGTDDVIMMDSMDAAEGFVVGGGQIQAKLGSITL